LKDYFTSLGIVHPDEMSGMIVKCFHRRLNDKPLNIEAEAEIIKNITI
jgi:hypothetical protein